MIEDIFRRAVENIKEKKHRVQDSLEDSVSILNQLLQLNKSIVWDLFLFREVISILLLAH